MLHKKKKRIEEEPMQCIMLNARLWIGAVNHHHYDR